MSIDPTKLGQVIPRRGLSLLELLVVLAIIGTMTALALPAIQNVRSAASRTTCANNMRQIGLAIHSNFDSHSRLPYARQCPAPWRNGQDINCQSLPSPNVYTGPNEKWWAPYDNRPGTTPTQALKGFAPESFLWDFIGRDRRVFICPEGIDRTPTSPTFGETYQISYALNPAIGGKKYVEAVLHLWEHDDLPLCESQNKHWATWPLDAEQRQLRHAPRRHNGTTNVLGHDARVWVSQ